MDNESFSNIYNEYYKSSFLFVKSYVRDRMVAEDIVSETLFKFWQMLRNEEVEYPKTLLVTMLKNSSLNFLKHEEVKQSAMESISSKMFRDLDYRIATLEACDPQEIFSSEITSIVEKTLAALPRQTRRVFEMSRFEHIPVKEIAQALHITPKAVEYHITKSLKALRVNLKEYMPLLGLLMGL